MADQKISALTELTDVATDDLLPLVDISDTSMAATGTTKKATAQNVVRDIGDAAYVELAGDTMTGALTIQLTGTSQLKGPLQGSNQITINMDTGGSSAGQFLLEYPGSTSAQGFFLAAIYNVYGAQDLFFQGGAGNDTSWFVIEAGGVSLGLIVGTGGALPILFNINRTEVGRITTGGDWAIGPQQSANARLHVHQDTLGAGVLSISSAATNDDVNYLIGQARAATTDATQTTLTTIAITASTTYLLEAHVLARRTGGSAGTADDGAVYIRRAMVTTKGGTVTINAVQDGLTQEDQAGWDCTFTVSGSNVLLRVTGATNNNVTWHATIYLQLVGS